MADTKISALTAASALDLTEPYPLVQSSTTKKATGAQLQTALAASAANAKDTTNTTKLLTPANLLDVGAARLLWELAAADMNSTADQAFTKVGTFSTFQLLQIKAAYVSGASLTTAAGGIYTATSKGGTAIVANTQTYTNNTGAGLGTNVTIVASVAGGLRSDSALYLSLTTAQGSAGVAYFRIYGMPLS